MRIRCATGRFDPGRARRSAFRRSTAGFDRARGQFLAVSSWGTEEQARTADEVARRLRREFAAMHDAGGAPRPGPANGGQPRYDAVIAQA